MPHDCLCLPRLPPPQRPMTLAYSKAKGREAENAVVAYLAANGYPHAERRRLSGSSDRGDIAGVVGRVIEVKDEKTTDLAGWMRELAVEMANDGADQGVVIRKRKGFPWRRGEPESVVNVGEWYAVMPVRLLVALWRELDGVDEVDEVA